jgi:coproporphyrinogen III oxidase
MTTDSQKQMLTQWFSTLQNDICGELESLELSMNPNSQPQFNKKSWNSESMNGGGVSCVFKNGAIFEKAGVNVSTVWGEFSEQFRCEIPGADADPSFWAAGISVVIHPLNPFVPIIHMNTRHIITTKSWFGGGIDLTPVIQFDEDTYDFHHALKNTCDRHDPTYYDQFKPWCDRYFYIPHRQEARGVGGIFYDYINSGSFDNDFAFTQDVGKTFISIYSDIVKRHYHKSWDESHVDQQLSKRGRYVEFNLVYDRGTRFGLMTQGNMDAVLMSMPPLAQWK